MRGDLPINWTSGAAWLMAFINLVLGFTLLDGVFDYHPVDVSITWRNIFSGFLFVMICLPMLITAIVLAVVGIRRGEPFGVASILLNVLVFAFVIYFQVIDPVFLDTPERRHRRAVSSMEARHKRAIHRENGDISLTTESIYYKVATHRGWLPACAGVLGLGIAMRIVARKRASSLEALPPAQAGESVAAMKVQCPQCQVDVTKAIATGLSRCPSCNLELVGARRSADEGPESFSPLQVLMYEGSSIQRIIALLGVIIWVGLGLTWFGLILAGHWIASKNVACVLVLPLARWELYSSCGSAMLRSPRAAIRISARRSGPAATLFAPGKTQTRFQRRR